ncbi:MAG: Uma2 family endonuclease [Anaerolineales bacterium]
MAIAIASIQIERKLFTVDEYEQMIAAGVLHEDERLELIEGDILTMSPIGGLHVRVVNTLNRLFVQRLADQAVVSVQNPVRLANSEPQPDLAILRPEVNEDAPAVPSASDVYLLIEVSDTTATYDRTVKVPLYAREGIRETWLLDLSAGVIEVYRGAGSAGYKTKESFAAGDTVFLQALPDVRLTVDEILGSSQRG